MKNLRWLLDTPIAHRGLHSPGIPENSMAAFREAIRNGFSIELDVHKTRDDVLVVFHDENLSRMTGDERLIGDCTFPELRQLVLDQTEERIPALADVLDLVHGQAGMLVEIKTHPAIGKREELISQILDRYHGKFAVVSFNPWILRWFLKNRPSYIRGQISGGLASKKISGLPRFLHKNLLVIVISRPDFIAYEYRYLNAWIRMVAGISRLPVIVWTIRDTISAVEATKAADNIIFEGFTFKKD